MSSIFTFNPSPPKPSSPWATPSVSTPDPPSVAAPPTADGSGFDDIPGHLRTSVNSGRVRGTYLPHNTPPSSVTTPSGETISTLSAEPQIGSTEYKLSLARGSKDAGRLEQLTTQLLWRLQQSTPFHATSLAEKTPEKIAGLLQESQGALYELGVADDGTLVGLEEGELEESLAVLGEMAGKVGAEVEVLRKVFVRTVEEADVSRAKRKLEEHVAAKMRGRRRERGGKAREKVREEEEALERREAEKFRIPTLDAKLWVVEAMVRVKAGAAVDAGTQDAVQEGVKSTEELRVSLTGPTTSGKSTLLGTLTTGELDNGRGKSRLSLLRHRHEMITGVTSSVAWEVFGYKPAEPSAEDVDEDDGFFGGAVADTTAPDTMSRLVNYASGHISSWTDIHSAAAGGRIVFMSDSAGHVKYRRTTIRSLVGWAPHYTLLLIAANDGDTSPQPGLSEASREHIELCLKLGLRLVLVFTKIDIASKTGLREVLSQTLGLVKEGGRKPVILRGRGMVAETVSAMRDHPETTVPVLFVSAVRGDNMELLHELLMELPIPPPVTPPGPSTLEQSLSKLHLNPDVPAVVEPEEKTRTLFHVEELFDLQTHSAQASADGAIVSGHLRYGRVSVGDTLLVGPFSTDDVASRSATPTPTATPTPGSSHLTAHRPDLLSRSPESGDETARSPHRRGRSNQRGHGNCRDEKEWREVRVISIRHLRLPVNTLRAGEAGTMGVIPLPATKPDETDEAAAGRSVSFADPPAGIMHSDHLHLRKGHVLLDPGICKAYTGFSAVLSEGTEAERALAVGSDVTVYIASVRAVAKIVNVERHGIHAAFENGNGGVFDWDEDDDKKEEKPGEVVFGFDLAGTEWMEHGAEFLVMTSGGGMVGFVGRVVERWEA